MGAGRLRGAAGAGEIMRRYQTTRRYLTAAEEQARVLAHSRVNVFEKLLAGLAKSMTDMCSKLPERYDKLKARAELAQRVIAAAGQA